MLVLLPAFLVRSVGMDGVRIRVETLKELGGKTRGPAPYFLGIVYEFPDHLFEEWQDVLGILHFS